MELKNYCRPDFALPGLRDLIALLPRGTVMVEVGSFAGESAEEFLKHEQIAHFHAVGPMMGGYDDSDPASFAHPMKGIEAEFDQRVQPFVERVTKHRMTSAAAIHRFPDRSLDFVYIDALHTYEGAKIDINMWRHKIKPGGILGGHDYEPTFPGVIQAVDETFGKPDQTFSEHSWMKRIS